MFKARLIGKKARFDPRLIQSGVIDLYPDALLDRSYRPRRWSGKRWGLGKTAECRTPSFLARMER